MSSMGSYPVLIQTTGYGLKFEKELFSLTFGCISSAPENPDLMHKSIVESVAKNKQHFSQFSL